MMPLRFAHPWALLGLGLVPLAAWWLWRGRSVPHLRYSDLGLMRDLPRSSRVRLWGLPNVLRVLILALLVVAVARPQAVRQREVIRGRGVDIVLALDISGSMAALDFEPSNRLEAAKEVIGAFVKERKYDRIGLVVFAREAFRQSPPTFDYDALRQLLEVVRLAPELQLDDGTAIGMGLAQAADMLQQSDAQSRVIILLTDGVNNSGEIDPLTAAQAAAALGVKVYAIGMGRPGQVPFPVNDPVFGRRTRLIRSEIDEEILQQIAETTEGRYFRATDSEGLAEIYAEINRMEKSEVEVEVFTRYRELGAWLLWPALGLLAVELLLRNTWLRALP
ncbi:MAG: VWA domain-containing protein [Anaerolineae bacterium]|nr:VWA domain-containing protein [Anaerolineae bacterium]